MRLQEVLDSRGPASVRRLHEALKSNLSTFGQRGNTEVLKRRADYKKTKRSVLKDGHSVLYSKLTQSFNVLLIVH